MNEEKKYPIYIVSIKWDDDNFQGNGIITQDRMFRNYPSYWEAVFYLIDRWAGIFKDKDLASKHPVNIKIEMKFKEEETWCLRWFQHYTYNIHLSDEELLESFNNFVCRKYPLTIKDPSEYCLMGADERRRWSGPCRCEHCQEKGWIIIDH